MEPRDSLAIVQAWLDASNVQDVERLLQLSAPDIEIVGPRSTGYGHDLLREWMARAGLTLTTLRTFAEGKAIVVEQLGEWRAVESGEVTGSQNVSSSFLVEGDRVARVARFDDLDTALADAGLTRSDI